MFTRWLASLALVGLFLAPVTAAPEKAAGPSLAVQFKPLDELLKDVEHIAKLTDNQSTAPALIKSTIEGVLGEDWKDAIDATQPFGVFGVVDVDLTKSYGVLLLPAKDEKKFIKVIEKFGVKPEQNNGIYSFTPPGLPLPVYFRFANGYAYATLGLTGDEPIKGTLPKVTELLPATEKGLLAIKVFISSIPVALKKQAINGLEELIKQLPINDEAAEAQMKEAVDQLKSVITDGKEFVLRLDFDRATNDAGLEFTLSGTPNTKLAKELLAYSTKKNGKTISILGTDSVAGLTLNFPSNINQANKDQQIDAFTTLIEQGLDAIGIDTDEKALKPLTKVLVETLGTDLDATASIRGPVNGKWGFIGGIGVNKGKTLETAIKKFITTLDKDDQARFKVDAQKVGSFTLHHFVPEAAIPDDAKKLFGPKPVWYLAFTDDLVVVGFGEPTKELLEPLATVKAVPSPTMEFTVNTGRLPTMIAAGKDEKDKKIIDALKKEFPKGETVKVLYATVEGGTVAKFRYGTDLGSMTRLVKAMGEGAGSTFKEAEKPKKKCD